MSRHRTSAFASRDARVHATRAARLLSTFRLTSSSDGKTTARSSAQPARVGLRLRSELRLSAHEARPDLPLVSPAPLSPARYLIG